MLATPSSDLPSTLRTAFVLSLTALALAGCGTVGSGRLFGGGGDAAPTVSATTATRVPAIPGTNEPLRCPRLDIMSGTETLRVGGDGDPQAVRYQVTLGDTARECRQSGGTATMKVGVSGRVILGPAGQPGSFTAPVRIVVTRGLREPVYSELRRVPVSVPAGQTSGAFSFVEDNITINLPGEDRLTGYRILIGFDEQGA